MSTSVFVYSDGTVGLRDLRDAGPVFRMVKPRPFTYTPEDAYQPLTVDVEEYQQRGRMLDRRPVFCARGFTLEEACITSVCIDTEHKRQAVDMWLRDQIRRYVKREYHETIELDEWYGQVPMALEDSAMLVSQGLTKRGVRLLVVRQTA